MNIVELFDPTQSWYLQPGVIESELERLEQKFGFKLPADYRELMRWSNGGDFQLGERYFRLWSVADVEDANTVVQVQRWIPNALAIANDAGDFWYLLDYTLGSAEAPVLIELEAGNLDRADAILWGASLTAAIRTWIGLDDARARLLGCMATRATRAGR